MPTKNALYPWEIVEKKALETHLEMVQADPKNAALHYELGWLYEQSGAYEHALDQWLEPIQLDSGNLAAWEAILAILMKRKKVVEDQDRIAQ